MGAENLDIRVVMHGNGLAVLMYPDEVEGTKMKRGNANEEMLHGMPNIVIIRAARGSSL